MFIRNPYNYDRNEASRETGLLCLDAGRTQQQFKDECDINIIIEKFGITGHLPITTVQPLAGDFTEVQDFQSAVQAVQAATDNFMALPSKVREKFHNNPQKFVDFCVDPANIEAVRELGLAPRPPAPTMTQIMEKKDGE